MLGLVIKSLLITYIFVKLIYGAAMRYRGYGNSWDGAIC